MPTVREEIDERIRRMYADDMFTTTEISRMTGFTPATICKRLKKIGVKLRPGGNPQASAYRRIKQLQEIISQNNTLYHKLNRMYEKLYASYDTSQFLRKTHLVGLDLPMGYTSPRSEADALELARLADGETGVRRPGRPAKRRIATDAGPVVEDMLGVPKDPSGTF